MEAEDTAASSCSVQEQATANTCKLLRLSAMEPTCMAHSAVGESTLPGIIGGGSSAASLLLLLPPLSSPLPPLPPLLLTLLLAGAAATPCTAIRTTPASSSARAWWPTSDGWMPSAKRYWPSVPGSAQGSWAPASDVWLAFTTRLTCREGRVEGFSAHVARACRRCAGCCASAPLCRTFAPQTAVLLQAPHSPLALKGDTSACISRYTALRSEGEGMS